MTKANGKRKTNPRSLENLKLGAEARNQGKQKLNVTLLPKTIRWLKARGNASLAIDDLVANAKNEAKQSREASTSNKGDEHNHAPAQITSNKGDEHHSKDNQPPVPFTIKRSDEYNPSSAKISKAVFDFFDGRVELDPYSNSFSTSNIPSQRSFINADGMEQEWKAETLYMHPPHSEARRGLAKLKTEYDAGHVQEALALVTGNDVANGWFNRFCKPTAMCHFGYCELTSPVLVYFGENVGKFEQTFKNTRAEN